VISHFRLFTLQSTIGKSGVVRAYLNQHKGNVRSACSCFQDEERGNKEDPFPDERETSLRSVDGGIPSFLPDRAVILDDLCTCPHHLFLILTLVVTGKSGEDA